MFESLKRYIFIDLYESLVKKDFVLAHPIFESSHTNIDGFYQFSYLSTQFARSKFYDSTCTDSDFIVFCFSDNEIYNFSHFKSNNKKIADFYRLEVLPFIQQNYPELISADFSDMSFWSEQFKKAINKSKSLHHAHNENRSVVAINLYFPDLDRPIRDGGFYPPIHTHFRHPQASCSEQDLQIFTRNYFQCLIDTYRDYFQNDREFSPLIHRKFNRNLFYFEQNFYKYYDLPSPQPFAEKLVIYNCEEMNFRSELIHQFEDWWAVEGRWLESGVSDQSKRIAEAAWLKSRELTGSKLNLEDVAKRIQDKLPHTQIKILNHGLIVSFPQYKLDGDSIPVYVKLLGSQWKLSDGASVFGGELNAEEFLGRRKELLDNLLEKTHANLDDGEIFTIADASNLTQRLIDFNEALHGIYNLIVSSQKSA